MRILRAFLPALLYAALIFALSSRQDPPSIIPSELLQLDKLLHAVEYAALAALLVHALRSLGVSAGRAFLLTVGLASLYGATDEFHQWFVPGRNADVLDWMADTVGAAAGAGLMSLVNLALRRPRAAG